ncbi:MAG: hypothetical protein Q7J54_00380 [Candidatus Woesearchaeota archaeon]|nr:hypothetical protein [Candidatus Woesearchaeota archaeon]
MALKKKAIFFTIIAILLVGLILVSFSIISGYKLRDRMAVVETRISTMNSFIDDAGKDMGRGLYISGFRSILGMEQFIVTRGAFITNASSAFSELMINGSYNGTEINIMEGSTFVDWMNKIKAEAGKIGIIMDFTVNEIKIYQQEPWFVGIDLNITLNIADERNTAKWSNAKYVTTKIGIEGFEDPLYNIYSYGRVTNTIARSNETYFSDAELIGHLLNSRYIASITAPNFLMRLEGKFNSDASGIESLVNLGEFSAQEIPIYARSGVDYLYFSNSTLPYCTVNETASSYSWFKLDSGHLSTYSAACTG